jgi:hypothetical protein
MDFRHYFCRFIWDMSLSRLFLVWVVLGPLEIFAQSGTITGKVFNKINNDPIPSATVVVQGSSIGAVTDINGRFQIDNLEAGMYNLEFSFVGFKSVTIFEVQITAARPAVVEVGLEEEATTLESVEIIASNRFIKSEESPLSLRSIGPSEIKRTPGGNRDISKVIRSLPGVASTPSFRNDIIIRGGAPSENSFYLDGIQIPVINHFQTQGSSGGPVGIINVDLLSEVNFYSGAFPSNRGNTMSSVFDFRLKDGRNDKWIFNGILGATDLGVTLEGPVSKKSSLVFSVRRSYLKFLFNIFNLPFLPVYNDAQFKYKHKIDSKNQITFLGIGAIDDFSLNLDAPDEAKNEEEREEAEYILNALPVSTQWNYTLGLKYEHFREHGTTALIVSQSALNVSTIKYQNNEVSAENLVQDYNSRETETRVRLEDDIYKEQWKINYGAGYERALFDTRDFNRIVTQEGYTERNYNSKLSINKYSLFGQISRTFDRRLTLSAGVRTDANDYSSEMSNPLKQLSPRISASYSITDAINANFNAGIYYQLPAYTILGYRDSQSAELINKGNGVTFIQSKHLVGGFEFNLQKNSRITIESFYKRYDNYPFLLEDSISLANLGADFGTIGNAPVTSTSKGKSYGIEFLVQQKLYKGFYGLLSYTWVVSKFTDKDANYVPSSWDNRHLVSLTGGKKFAKNWEVGVRWLFTGGSPYTPFDVPKTVYRQNWDVRPYGVPDYDKLNSQRITAFHQLDIRIDKKYYFKKWSLDVYLDVQNAYNHITEFQESIDVQRDTSGEIIIDPVNPDYYLPKFIQNTYGQILPTVGLIVEL